MRIHHFLIGIIVLAVALRVFAFGFALHEKGAASFISGDAIGYVELANNLITGQGFSSTIQGVLETNSFRTPGFPILLAPFTLFPNGLVAYGFLMALVAGILLPLLLYGVARRLAGERVALVASFLIAVEPHAVFYSFLLQTEVSFVLFSLAGLLVALRAYDHASYVLASFAGFLFGYATLIRPGFWLVLVLIVFGTLIVLIYKREPRFKLIALMLFCAYLVLIPWLMRNQAVTGAYALSGMGWRNVYTDYVSSVRSLEKNSPYHLEKNGMKDEAMPRFGLTWAEVSNPANAHILRDAALAELWQHKTTVVKLQVALLTSFFINDGYYYEFRNLGFISEQGVSHISPTAEVLKKGIGALPLIWEELVRQKFVPLFGRAFTGAMLVLSIAGFLLMRHPLRLALLCAILLSALFATVIGLGLDARMRFPVQPIFFIFASVALVYAYDHIRRRA